MAIDLLFLTLQGMDPIYSHYPIIIPTQTLWLLVNMIDIVLYIPIFVIDPTIIKSHHHVSIFGAYNLIAIPVTIDVFVVSHDIPI